MAPPPRRYTTRSSAHGSGFVPHCSPERFEMSMGEAVQDVLSWRIKADTVGGDAIVVESLNGLLLLHEI